MLGAFALRVLSDVPGASEKWSGRLVLSPHLGLVQRGVVTTSSPTRTFPTMHAGHWLAARTGTVGFLARELMPELLVLLEELHTDRGD